MRLSPNNRVLLVAQICEVNDKEIGGVDENSILSEDEQMIKTEICVLSYYEVPPVKNAVPNQP
jgi:hypothetical protein